jgi:hypothetical protein
MLKIVTIEVTANPLPSPPQVPRLGEGIILTPRSLEEDAWISYNKISDSAHLCDWALIFRVAEFGLYIVSDRLLTIYNLIQLT